MAEENQVQQVTKEPQQVKQVMKEPQQAQRVTTKNPKIVEVGKRLAAHNRRKREEQRKEQAQFGEDWSKPILWHRRCYSSGSDRWSWLLHLSVQERPHDQRSHDASLPTTTPPGASAD